MSVRHPNISAWTRDEHDGAYTSELFDWTLRTSWIPNTPTERGYFSWQATREGEPEQRSDIRFEELEAAMAAAEDFARADAARRGKPNKRGSGDSSKGHAEDDAA